VKTKKGLFNVKSFYIVVVHNDGTPFLWRSIWQIKVPLRATFFAWSAAQGKIFTIDNLRKLHVIVVYWCYMCKMNEKYMDYLLLYCDVDCALWNAIFNLVGLYWVMPRWVVNFLE
jgi:hypothetical protein